MNLVEFPERLRFLFQPARYKVVYGGRGGAKSWGLARALLTLGSMKPLRILCARETQKSIADSVHKLLSDQVTDLGLGPFYTVQQATIIGRNGTEFIFAGLKHNINNIKSLEGADIVWVEEAQTTSKDSWEKLIPTVRKPGSEIWVSFNPELATDDTYKRFVLNPPPSAVVVKIGYEDNPWFPDVLRVEMEHLERTDPTAYEHVYGGACLSGVEGAIYAEEMKKVDAEGRICLVPYDMTKPVDTAWDLGFGDPTCIWFIQAYGGFWNFIDYEEGEGLTIADYVIRLQNKNYVYGRDFLPHDAGDNIIHTRLRGSGDQTLSIPMLMRAAGRKVLVTPKLLKADTLNASRTLFANCRFDSVKCADGLQALRHYQWDKAMAEPGNRQTMKPGKREPLHNWACHAPEAFQNAAVSIKQPGPVGIPLPPPRRNTNPHAWQG